MSNKKYRSLSQFYEQLVTDFDEERLDAIGDHVTDAAMMGAIFGSGATAGRRQPSRRFLGARGVF